MTNQYPVSEQIARGAVFFEPVLAEISLKDGSHQEDKSVHTGTLPLHEQWGPFTHFSLEASVGGYAIGRGGQCYNPQIEIALLLDPEIGDTGYVSSIYYDGGRSISAADVSKTFHFTKRGIRKFKPRAFDLTYRALSEPMRPGDPPTDDGIAGGELGTDMETDPEAQVLAQVFEHGVDFLESLGGVGLMQKLREEEPTSLALAE